MPLKKIDSITLWKRSGVDKFSQSTFDDPVGIDVRWDELTQRMVDDAGQDFVSKGTIYNDVEDQISMGDRVLLREYLVGDIDHGFEDSLIVKATRVDRNGTGLKRLDSSYLGRAT